MRRMALLTPFVELSYVALFDLYLPLLAEGKHQRIECGGLLYSTARRGRSYVFVSVLDTYNKKRGV